MLYNSAVAGSSGGGGGSPELVEVQNFGLGYFSYVTYVDGKLKSALSTAQINYIVVGSIATLDAGTVNFHLTGDIVYLGLDDNEGLPTFLINGPGEIARG